LLIFLSLFLLLGKERLEGVGKTGWDKLNYFSDIYKFVSFYKN